MRIRFCLAYAMVAGCPAVARILRLQLVPGQGDKVEAGPLAVRRAVECGLGEESRITVAFALYVEALHVCVIRVLVVYPGAFDDTRSLVAALVHIVDFVSFAVCDCDGGAVSERDVVAFGVWVAGKSLSDEVLVKEPFLRY